MHQKVQGFGINHTNHSSFCFIAKEWLHHWVVVVVRLVSRRMTGNYTWFSSFTKIEISGDVSFGDNLKRKGNVGKVSSTLIENACLVENLKQNLISISQLCDKGYKVIFDKIISVIENACDNNFFVLLEIDVVIFTLLI